MTASCEATYISRLDMQDSDDEEAAERVWRWMARQAIDTVPAEKLVELVDRTSPSPKEEAGTGHAAS